MALESWTDGINAWDVQEDRKLERGADVGGQVGGVVR